MSKEVERYQFAKGRQSGDVVAERAEYIKDLLMSNISNRSDIYEMVSREFGQLSERTVRYDIQRAKALLAKANGVEIGYTFTRHINLYDDMISQHMKDQDYRQAREAMKHKETLLGLHDNTTKTTFIQQNIISQASKEDTVDLSKIDDTTLQKLLDTYGASPTDENQTDMEDAHIVE